MAEPARCCGCDKIIPDREGRGWWHPDCHEIATHEVKRSASLWVAAKMLGYTGK